MTRAPRASDPPAAMLRSSLPPVPATDPRLESLRCWLQGFAARHALAIDTIRPASADASFRRYFRVDTHGGAAASLIVMDAPPPQEDCRPFVRVASVLRDAGLRVPAIVEADVEHGFLLLDDLGGETLLDRLARNPGMAEIEWLYRGAGQALVTMQTASRPGVFPDYDGALLDRELMLYPDWYLTHHRGFQPTDDDRNVLRAAFDALLANNLAQPRVYVHRDYHSRNLMIGATNGSSDGAGTQSGARRAPRAEFVPGVLDFQDAVFGPITYDLVSLLRDAYVAWPEELQIDWAIRWWESARARGLPLADDFGEFWRDFEWMGLQRHLKVLGIFARLNYRDGKDRYLADLPRVLAPVIAVAGRYGAFTALARLIDRVENRAARLGATF